LRVKRFHELPCAGKQTLPQTGGILRFGIGAQQIGKHLDAADRVHHVMEKKAFQRPVSLFVANVADGHDHEGLIFYLDGGGPDEQIEGFAVIFGYEPAFPLSEAVGVMLFFKAGEILQNLAVGRSRRSIRALLASRPDHANVESGEGLRQVPPEQV
jgi:hypothetical protein